MLRKYGVSNPFIAGHSFLQVNGSGCLCLLFGVSNPFIAGHSFLLRDEITSRRLNLYVSNPFIAGHSFLLRDWIYQGVLDAFRFKPLHSGAFLLTLAEREIPFAFLGFKPLHSGAFLLTTIGMSLAALLFLTVSNPFIAGHSFLQNRALGPRLLPLKFQTPS